MATSLRAIVAVATILLLTECSAVLPEISQGDEINATTNQYSYYHDNSKDTVDTDAAILESSFPSVNDGAMTVKENDVEFRLFTRSHPVDALSVTVVDVTNRDFIEGDWLSKFFHRKKVVVVTHGFRGSGDDEMCTAMRDAYLYTNDVNVIIVHWENLAKFNHYLSYGEAANHTRYVGQRVASLLDHVVNQSPTSVDDLHLIGFSLGAHVMGHAGHVMTAGKVARITGLDPAKPYFENKPRSLRLDATDAQVVDVVHAETVVLGFRQRLGHVDFYPNGAAATQPPCVDAPAKMMCSHRMAWRYYVSSVYHPRQFVAQRCDSWEEYVNATEGNATCLWEEKALMGPDLDTSARGMYFLATLSEPPYCATTTTTEDDSVNTPPQSPTSWLFWPIRHAPSPDRGHDSDVATSGGSSSSCRGVAFNDMLVTLAPFLLVPVFMVGMRGFNRDQGGSFLVAVVQGIAIVNVLWVYLDLYICTDVSLLR